MEREVKDMLRVGGRRLMFITVGVGVGTMDARLGTVFVQWFAVEEE